ncbi:cupredoxin domain-containing protein [Alicycliphilus sp. T452]|jgi:hypothetical protein
MALRFLFAAWLALGLLLGPAQAGAQGLPTFTVIARDGLLLPARLEVPAGQRLKLVLRNEGQGPVEFENLNLRVEKVLAPGASSFVVTPPLKPGVHEFIDEFHAETGRMQLIAR